MQSSRKSLEKLFGVCGSPASPTENFLVFAGVPQVPREMLWRLREPRKSLGKLFGICGNPASPTKNFLAFAGVPQALKLIQYEEWECSLSAVHAKKQALVSLPVL